MIFMNLGIKKFIVDIGGFLGASAIEGICNHILPPKGIQLYKFGKLGMEISI